ncbi:MAG: methyltransferase domain-containing protein [Salinisphaeraceae bacterium]|nr:methyltransferase domain-containing protein [Salinisphaeraceae bacterium]
MSNPDQDRIPFSKASAVERYESKRYKSSLQRRVDAREQATLRELLRDHVGEGDLHALDLPCGYGRFLPLFHGLGYRVTSVDISEHMTDYVRQRPDFGPNDHAEPGDVRAGLSLADESMDVTCCIRLFQHFHYPEWRQEALKEFARVSKRHVMVTFYDKACVHYWTKRLVGALKGKKPRVQMISRAQFEADAAAAGLRVVEYRPWLPRIHAQTFTMLEKV